MDTHAWLWWLTEDTRLSPAASRVLDSQDVVVPAICCWEVAMLAQRGRIEIEGGVQRFLNDALAWEGVRLAPLDPEVAVLSVELGDFSPDPADRLIVATAITQQTALVTADRAIRRSGLVEVLWD